MPPLNIVSGQLKNEKKRKDHFKDILIRPGSSKLLEIRTLELYGALSRTVYPFQARTKVMMLESQMGLLRQFDSDNNDNIK